MNEEEASGSQSISIDASDMESPLEIESLCMNCRKNVKNKP